MEQGVDPEGLHGARIITWSVPEYTTKDRVSAAGWPNTTATPKGKGSKDPNNNT